MHYLLKVLFPWVLTFYFLNIFLIYIFLIFSSGDFMCFQTKSSWDFIVSWKIGYDGKRRICVLQCGIVHQVSVTMCKHLSLQFMKFFNVTLLYNFWESVGNYYFWMLRWAHFLLEPRLGWHKNVSKFTVWTHVITWLHARETLKL